MFKIRVRMWHRLKKTMFSPDQMGEDQLTLLPDGRGFINVSGVSTQLSTIFPLDTCVPMLSLCRCDKNGTEVFQDDILERAGSSGKVRFIVRWSNSDCCFSPEWIGGVPADFCFADNLTQYRVIGNIHENPELEWEDMVAMAECSCKTCEMDCAFAKSCGETVIGRTIRKAKELASLDAVDTLTLRLKEYVVRNRPLTIQILDEELSFISKQIKS